MLFCVNMENGVYGGHVIFSCTSFRDRQSHYLIQGSLDPQVTRVHDPPHPTYSSPRWTLAREGPSTEAETGTSPSRSTTSTPSPRTSQQTESPTLCQGYTTSTILHILPANRACRRDRCAACCCRPAHCWQPWLAAPCPGARLSTVTCNRMTP